MTRSIWIARHGERQDMIEPTWSETAEQPFDPPLSEGGFQQARDVGRRLANENIAHIFASPFLRTLQTATEVAEILNLSINVEPGIGEMLKEQWYPFGDPRTWTIEQRKALFPRINETYTPCGQSTFPEDWDICKQRTGATLRTAIEKYEGNVLFVGHGASVSSMAWGVVKGYPGFTGKTCSLVKLVHDPSRDDDWHVELGGDTSHLSHSETVVRFH